MKMKIVAGGAFLLNTFLFGSYYSVAKEVLGRVDPIVFSFFVMMTLVPPAVCIIALTWRHITREIVKSGFLLGSCLCLGLFTLSVALKYNSATGTAFFPSLNGLVAALITWLFLRQPITRATWLAGAIAVSGAALLIMNAGMGGVRGALIAFIGGLFCTFYVFLADHEQKDKTAYWSLFGIELLTMALWANLVALLFGDWHMVNFSLPKDILVILYIGLGTTFLPILITVLLQKYISPITVSFIYILEPILGAIVAYLYLGEMLPLGGYIGGGLVVIGAVIHTWSTVGRPASEDAVEQQQLAMGTRSVATRGEISLIGGLIYPVLCCGIGGFIVYKLGGFPPLVWSELYRMWPQLPTLMHNGRGTDVMLLAAQSSSWLIAWIALIIMGSLVTYRAVGALLTPLHASKVVELDVRTLRQMGYTPYTSTSTRKKEDNLLVQRRRMNRRVRLARVEMVESNVWE